ncbi:MAG: hypothetical protein AAGE03_02125 [Pseudomonadota bacterium]
MESHVMETVTFRLVADSDAGMFERAARDMAGWLKGRPGFVARRLSCGADGLWIEQIEWTDMAAAKAAAAEIGHASEVAPFVQAINGQSVVLHHSDIRVALG